MTILLSVAVIAGIAGEIATAAMSFVPEPGTLVLGGTGLLFGLGCWLRKRMK